MQLAVILCVVITFPRMTCSARRDRLYYGRVVYALRYAGERRFGIQSRATRVGSKGVDDVTLSSDNLLHPNVLIIYRGISFQV